jgi:DivIVA domain-containing protein
MLTPREIENKRFTVVRLRPGYDQEEVDDYLDKVHDTVLKMEAMTVRHTPPDGTTQVIPPQPQVSPTSLERLLIAAEQAAEQTRYEAKVEAEQSAIRARDEAEVLLGNTRIDATSIIENARKQAEAIVNDATAEKHRQIGELEEQRARLKEKVDELTRAETEVTTRMRNALERWNT